MMTPARRSAHLECVLAAARKLMAAGRDGVGCLVLRDPLQYQRHCDQVAAAWRDLSECIRILDETESREAAGG